MSTKKEFTLAELQSQCEEAKKNFERLNKLVEAKQQEEKKLREEQLAKEKSNRKHEVDEAINKCRVLIKAYMNDYGIYSLTSTDDNVVFSSKFWNMIM